MTAWNVAGLICLAAVLLPFVFYLSVKLGVYAWHRGTQLFQEEQSQRRVERGNEEG